MTESKRQLRVFLCHASADKPIVRELYRRLVRDGVDVWLDETSLLPGMDWKLEIPRVVRSADAIIICLSTQSVTKEGYVQKEIRFALDAADEKPDGTIYILPVRLDACEIPSRLARWQWVDLFSSDGYRKLRISLRMRAEAIGAAMPSTSRKFEAENSHARQSFKHTNSPISLVNTAQFGFYGRLFAVLSVLILACAGLLWAGQQLVRVLPLHPSQTPLSTSTVTETLTPGITIPPTLPFSPTPFQPVVFPTATVPSPIPTSTFTVPPTQTSIPTFTFTASATPYPQPDMVLIPAGEFQMGGAGGDKDELPIHPVTLDAFYIDKYEVTNEMYLFCDQSEVCREPVDITGITKGDYSSGEYSNYPVVNVSWEMAKTYCAWRGARLPTEAEWEKAARGGLTDVRYPWGNDSPSCAIGARNGAQLGKCPKDRTVAVGSFSSNGYQVYDMVGNVWEWVGDWYQADYYASADWRNPPGPPSGREKILRGGSWASLEIHVSSRSPVRPETQDYEIGFRCARDANP